jgi:hypothetical protein
VFQDSAGNLPISLTRPESDAKDALLLDEENGIREASMQAYVGIGFHLRLRGHFGGYHACCAAAAASFLSFRFLRMPRRFAASMPFSSFGSNFFGASGFASWPPVVAHFELAGDAASIGL